MKEIKIEGTVELIKAPLQYPIAEDRPFACFLKTKALENHIVYRLRGEHEEGEIITVSGKLQLDGEGNETKGDGI